MFLSRFNIAVKVLLGYIALIVIGLAAAYYLYDRINRYFALSDSASTTQLQLLGFSGILSTLYENESYARVAIRMESEEGLAALFSSNDSLKKQLAHLKDDISFPGISGKIDSILQLLQKKEENYLALRSVYFDDQRSQYLNAALYKLSEIETALGKVTVEDFSKNPDKLSNREKILMNEIVSLLNKNRPPSETRKLNEKTLDSIVVSTKLLLNRVKTDATTQQRIILNTENALWENDNTISQQIRDILFSIERERTESLAELERERSQWLETNGQGLMIFGLTGLLLAMIFSFLVLQDFFKNQKLRKALEAAHAQAKSLLERREQLLSTVSHDIRSPLSSLLGYTDLLKKSELNPKQTYYLKNIDQSADYVHRLANDLLNYAQLEKNKIQLELRPFSLVQLTEEITNNCLSVLGNKAVAFTTKMDPLTPEILMGDAFRIKQILLNITINACKFTQEGFVRLEVDLAKKTRKAALIRFTIADSGPGMDATTQKKIFYEFTQGGEMNKKYGGAGLGLAIVKRLVSLMNGEIQLETQPEKGSTFTVVLPLSWPPAKSHETEKPQKKIRPNTQPVILWVDDDRAHLNLIKEWIGNKNVVLHTFNKPQKALEYLKTHPCDLLVTDIEMPGMSGVALAKEVRKISHLSQLTLIAVSGKTRLEIPAADTLFREFLQKPLSSKRLEQLLEKHIALKAVPTPEKSFPSLVEDHPFLKKMFHFLNRNHSALLSVLEVFIAENEKNLKSMEAALAANKMAETCKLAHKMLPMYRQLEAANLVAELEKLEQFTLSDKEQQADFYQNGFLDRLKAFHKELNDVVAQLKEKLGAV